MTATTTGHTQEELLSIDEAQKVLGNIGRTTLYALRKSGRLPFVSIGRRSFVRRADLDAFIASLAGDER